MDSTVIPREARRGAPSREVYNLVAREACVYHTSIARPAWFPLGYKSMVVTRMDTPNQVSARRLELNKIIFRQTAPTLYDLVVLKD